MSRSSGYRIGEVAKALGVGVDTLRYYERIGLVPAASRDGAGMRVYDDGDVARLRFVRRAQAMNFTLAEIASLLEVRARGGKAKRAARALAERKLADIDARLETLLGLREELAGLVAECTGSAGPGCPIIARIEG